MRTGYRQTNSELRDTFAFFALACGITWALDAPLARATIAHVPAPPLLILAAGLGAFGPAWAAFAMAVRRRQLREVFGRWRTSSGWVFAALFAVPALHVPATLIEVALGGAPAKWFYPPVAPEHLVALFFFSIGEEFGWRGFAYPRLAARFGPVLSAMIIGVVWTVWHLGMWVTPSGLPSLAELAARGAELVLASVVFAWFFEKGNRSMAVAIALHAGAHLDNVFRAPEAEVRLRVLRIFILMIAAVITGHSLAKRSSLSRRGFRVATPARISPGV